MAEATSVSSATLVRSADPMICRPAKVHAAMKAIADRGFIVAFSNRGARHHHRAVGLARLITEPLLTWEAVLAESWS